MRTYVVRCSLLAGQQHHHCVDTFTPVGVWYTDHRERGHRRMAGKRILDLGGIHVLPDSGYIFIVDRIKDMIITGEQSAAVCPERLTMSDPTPGRGSIGGKQTLVGRSSAASRRALRNGEPAPRSALCSE